MTIVKLTPDSNGAHKNQTSNISVLPEGWAIVPDNLISAWELYKPFVTISLDDGQIVGIEDNPEARAACESAQPAPQMDPILEIKLAIAELAEAMAAMNGGT
jgi:hypothetical protein